MTAYAQWSIELWLESWRIWRPILFGVQWPDLVQYQASNAIGVMALEAQAEREEV